MTEAPSVPRSRRASRSLTALAVAALLLTLALSACNGSATPATTGSLSVLIAGLPAGTAADVTISGPSGYASNLTAAATVSDLAPGTYAVTAASVGAYDPVVPEQVVEVEAGQTTTVTVSYQEPSPGALHECVPYAPSSAGADISGSWTASGAAGDVFETITVPVDAGGGYVTVTLQAPAPVAPNLFVEVVPETSGSIGGVVGGNNADPHSLAFAFEVAPGRSYLLTLRAANTVGGSATFPVDYTADWSFTSRVDCYEPDNDTLDTAKAIPLDLQIEASFIAGYRDVNSILTGHPTTQDWYRFELTTARAIEVSLDSVPSNVRARLSLFSEAGSQVGTVTADATGELVTLDFFGAELPAGWYTLRANVPFGVDRKANVSDGGAAPPHFGTNYQLTVNTLD